jgi:hypothetical protein
MSLCISENLVPSSTFWLVAGILFIAVLAVFELANKTKQETDLFSQSINNRLNMDISAIINRLTALEKKCAEKVCVVKTSPKKVKIAEVDSESED